MITLNFSVLIHAQAETVWDSLWLPENYKNWTSAFCEGSYYETENFAEGSKIHLLAPGGNGMYSVLEKVNRPQFLAFRHVGELVDYKEQPIVSQSWANAMETYSLVEDGANTRVDVQVDTDEAYIDTMKQRFPTALQRLKKMAEGEKIR